MAADHWVTTNEEEPIHVDVVDYLANVDGDTITISQGTTAPEHGTLSFDQANGDAIYTPVMDYYGSDSFDFVLTDSGGLTDSGTVYVTILNVNDPPDITNLSAILETAEDTDISTTFIVSDIDTDLADIILSGVASDLDLIASYEFTKSTDGRTDRSGLTIHPAENQSGTATVEITASDGDKSDTESLTLKVYAVNDPPVVVNDSATTDEDTPVTINVIANDTDVEDPNTLYVVSTTSPKLLSDGTAGHGTVINNNDGTLTYTPGANRNDDIFFTYHGFRQRQPCAAPVRLPSPSTRWDDAPTVVGDNRTIEEDTPVTIAVLSNDSDIEGDDFSIYSYTNPSHGSVSLDVDTQVFHLHAHPQL